MSNVNVNKNKNWAGGFPGNFSGNVWMTRNIDLERSQGRAILGDRMQVLVDDGDSGFTNLGIATKFLQSNAADNHATNSRWYFLCSNGTTGGRIFRTATAATPPSIVGTYEEDTTTDVPTDCLDMETHESVNGEQRLLVTRQGDIAILNKSGSANAWDKDWGTTVASLTFSNTSGVYHPIARLQRLVAIGDGNVLHTIDKNDVVSASRLVFPYGYQVRNIYASSDRFWIGLAGAYGQEAKVIEWDGSSLTYNNEYELIGTNPLCGFIVDNIPNFISDTGQIFKFSGGSFEVVQQFPLTEERRRFASTDITNYGAAVEGHVVRILVNFPFSLTSKSIRGRGGIWTFNTKNRNLYHSTSFGGYKTSGTDPDFGQSVVPAVGGLKFSRETNAVFDPFIIAGGQYYSAYSGTTENAVFRLIPNYGATARSSDRGRNRGQIITSFITSPELQSSLSGVWIKFKRFIDSENRIVGKARVFDMKTWSDADIAVTENQVLQKTGTWVTTTTFTCVVPTGVVAGDEVEVITGNGSGCTFHISSFSATPDGSTTITVTVDEALPSLNDSGKRGALFNFDNWTKLGVISTTSQGFQKLIPSVPLHGELIQVKLDLRGFEVEIDDIIPVWTPLITAEQI